MTEKQLENKCSNCKNLSVIISQMSDYYCYYRKGNDSYMNITDFITNCDGFEADDISLTEKEERVW